MSSTGSTWAGRVAVVTGAGGGIGSAIALELARRGATVVAMDPGVGVQGEPLGLDSAAQTAAAITAAGGTAKASTVSVTDAPALQELFAKTVADFGSLDVVVNTAGILRFKNFLDAPDDDWQQVLGIHLTGYLNVLRAALPLMATAGYGRIVGFTSGVGLARTSTDCPAYGSAKRAVAALTWQLAPLLPPGVVVNALSPIAGTRMVREALVASGAGPQGLDLSAMPQAEHMAPAAAYLAGDDIAWCNGRIVFSAGSEVSAMAPPRLLEAVRTEDTDVAGALATLVPVVLAPAEVAQRTGGGSNPRFGDVFSAAPAPVQDTGLRCRLVCDDPGATARHTQALGASGLTIVDDGPYDAAVVVSAGNPADASEPEDWQTLLDSYDAVLPQVLFHAAAHREAAEQAARNGQPMRIVHVAGAQSSAHRAAAQAVTQLVRSANDTAANTVLRGFAVSAEGGPAEVLAPFVARLLSADDTAALAGAELVGGDGWFGVRSHPAPAATAAFGGGPIPAWVDRVLREVFAR